MSVERIRELISYNRRDILGIDDYFRAKIAALHRWLYHYLDAELRGRYVALLRRLTPEERIRWLRANTWRIERLGAFRSAFYARAIVFEHDIRDEIRKIELYLPRIVIPSELWRTAVELKKTEVRFLEDLVVSIREAIPERPEWREEIERVLSRVRRRLEELLHMVGSLEGHVFDERTKNPIRGARVEIAGLVAYTDQTGFYRIDGIFAGIYRVRCSAPGYVEAEDTVEIVGAKVTRKDWWLKPVVPPPPKVWSYTLRVSARVVKGYAPGRAKRPARYPPREVTLELWMPDLPEEKKLPRSEIIRLLKIGYPMTKLKIKEVFLKSPIFVELFFEEFISSLTEEELEKEYKDKLVELIRRHEDDIARYMNMVWVELAEFDFGIEAKTETKFDEKESEDFYEIWCYLASGFSYLIADGYYKHKVGKSHVESA